MVDGFGSRLREARRAAGWSLRDLAARVHYNTGYLSKIENGLRPASVELARRCDDELGTGGALLRLVPPAVPRSARRTPAPRQLPAHHVRVVGRDDDLAAITGAIADGRRVVVVSGTAGVGKTTTALRWAHEAQRGHPDGQLYAAMRGFGPHEPVDSGEVLRGFLHDLGVAPQAIPAGLDERAALFRSLLADRKVLLVLDNARDTEHVRPLLPGSATCTVLITSRSPLEGLVACEGAYRRTLGLFDLDTSKELLETRVGAAAVAAEPAAAAELARLAAGLPLALSLLASRVAPEFPTPLAHLVAGLRDVRHRLDVLDLGPAEIDVRTVFSWSYDRLTPSAARLFRLLGLHPGPDIGVFAAAALTGSDIAAVRRDLAELVRTHMLTEHSPGRYHCHDLLRVYAAERARTEPETSRRQALTRVLDHYLYTAVSGDRKLYSNQASTVPGAPEPGAEPRDLPDYQSAIQWFDAERHVLTAAVRFAEAQGWRRHAHRLPRALAGFLRLRGHLRDCVKTQLIALAAAEEDGDVAAQADAHRLLAQATRNLGDLAGTEDHARRAIELYGRLGDRTGQALAHRHLAWAYHDQGDHRAAVRHHREALAKFRWSGHVIGEASSLNGLGWTTAHLGDHRAALSLCRQALAIAERTGDKHMRAAVRGSLGFVHHRLGEHRAAATHYRLAVTAFHELGNPCDEAFILHSLGDVHLAELDVEAARRSWRRAKTILDRLGHPRARAVADKLAALGEPHAPASRDRATRPRVATSRP